MTASEPSRWLLAIDTSTSTIVVAAGSTDGRLLAAEAFEGRYRHSQELLPAIIRVIERAGLRLADLAGVIVGTGPGAFTGLRVGIATGKTLAHELGVPIAGVASSSALLADVEHDRPAVLWLPSGPRDRIRIVAGEEPIVVSGDATERGTTLTDAGRPATTLELAVDLGGRASEAALALGRTALAGLPAALLRLGAERLVAGQPDDPERLVPRYASPPRGAPAGDSEGKVAWSRDPR
jgi:tRNA threonylcarbamoyl adenosine modification protein YeaZ